MATVCFSSTQTKKKVIYNGIQKLSEIAFEILCSDNFTIMFFENKKEIPDRFIFLPSLFENLSKLSCFCIYIFYVENSPNLHNCVLPEAVSACKAGSYAGFFLTYYNCRKYLMKNYLYKNIRMRLCK